MKSYIRLYPVSRIRGLDEKLRKFVQNPRKILQKYVAKNMTVLDIGCGPGLFSYEMAKMIGNKGKVVAADIDKEMLERLKNKISGLEIEKKIKIHKSSKNKIGLKEKFDFVLCFYMLHEVKDKKRFLEEVKSLMKKDAKFLIAEPMLQVSINKFEEIVALAELVGFKLIQKPKILLSRTAVLEKI